MQLEISKLTIAKLSQSGQNVRNTTAYVSAQFSLFAANGITAMEWMGFSLFA
jgi:hypothetical protein